MRFRLCLDVERINMSNFNCDKCGKPIIDSPRVYITGCEHNPIEEKKLVKPPKPRYDDIFYKGIKWLNEDK